LIASSGGLCADTAQVTLAYTATPSLGADSTMSICSGSSINLTTVFNTAGFTPSWTFNGTPVATPSAVSNAGVYILIASGSTCSDTAQVTLNVQPSPSLGPDQTLGICAYSTLDLTTLYSTTGFTTGWTSGGVPVPNPASVTTAGTYTLIATGSGSCADTAVVTVNSLATPSLGPDVVMSICSGTSADLTTVFNSTGFTPSWTFNGTPVATPSAVSNAGVYILIASGSTCSDTAQVTLNVQPSPSLGPDQTLGICAYSTLDLTTLYSTTGFTTGWTSGGVPVPNPASVTTAGTYTLIATGSGSCADTALVTVNSLATPSLGPDIVTGICSGNAADLTTLYSTAGYTTSWTSGGNPVSNPAAITTAGLYTLVATASSGCSDTANVTVTVGSTPALGPDQVVTQCQGTAVNLTAMYNTVGLTPSWILNGAPVLTPNSITNGGAYMLIAVNASGCADTAVVDVTFDPAPALGADQSLTACAGTAVDITAGFSLAGLTAVWTSGGTPVPDPANVATAGTYQLIATNSFGCSDTALVSVTVSAGPSLGPDQTFNLCSWQTIDLTTVFNITGLTASYTFNGAPITSYTSVYDSGMYAVNVTDANGCTDQALVIVHNVACICDADFSYDARCLQEPVTFTIQSDSALIGAHWIFGGGLPDAWTLQPTVKFRGADNFLVTLEAQLSCGMYTVQKYVTLSDCADSCHFYIPTAFTPNSDGHNDAFIWKGDCDPELFNIAIYNRYGQVVFKSDKPQLGWDGTYNNERSPEGMYVYTLEYKLPYQQKQVVSGKLNIVR
ncbi:MAG TPA: gliding motility-associated C-terminal domain-containing protein, partial [Bacteroidia bacterium]|nr:gliding motility-associated C-terminal domain-containing protein [Bacteroidia bacterium]